jgi:hypothetical protein
MAKFYDSITPDLRSFIERQHVFFVASATADSHINLSPKGQDTLRVLDERTVIYLDLVGSGNETAAHMKADGRLTIMFCSFEENPLIVRLFGRGRVVTPRDEEYAELHEPFNKFPGERQIIVLDVEKAQSSCGFGVPRYDLVAPRSKITEWAIGKGETALKEYQRRYNARSMDGLPNDTVPSETVAENA